MLRDTFISQEEHQRWFEKILTDTDNGLFRIMEHEGFPCGLVSLSRVDAQELSCEWGGYLSPDTPRGVGLGKVLMYLSIMIAFNHLALKQIVVEVIVGNVAAISLYGSMGFIQNKTKVKRIERQNGPADVIMMSLERDDWNSFKDGVGSLLKVNKLISE